jgi:hypothetical protein
LLLSGVLETQEDSLFVNRDELDDATYMQEDFDYEDGTGDSSGIAWADILAPWIVSDIHRPRPCMGTDVATGSILLLIKSYMRRQPPLCKVRSKG